MGSRIGSRRHCVHPGDDHLQFAVAGPRLERPAADRGFSTQDTGGWHASTDLAGQARRPRRDGARPAIAEPTDAIIRITSTAICGSDLHLYEVLGPVPRSRATSSATSRWASSRRSASEVTHIKPGDRVVVPFNISCGSCWMCSRGLFAQCETTQVREQGKGASLFGYTSLYGSVPGGQAEYLRVPQAHFGPIKVPDGPPGRAVPVPLRRAADRLAGGAVRRRARGRHARRARPRPDRPDGHPDRPAPRRRAGDRRRLGRRERLQMAARHGVETLDMRDVDDVADGADRADRRPRAGRGHRRRRHGGARLGPRSAGKVAQAAVGLLPDAVAQPLTDKVGGRPAGRAVRGAQGGPPRRHGVGPACTAARSTRCR